jgi:hypothetical protein
MALMIVGLVALVVAVMLAEAGSTAQLDRMFYAGAAMCAVGAAVFTIRVMLARRRA